jgi:hypothetical protein
MTCPFFSGVLVAVSLSQQIVLQVIAVNPTIGKDEEGVNNYPFRATGCVHRKH